MKKTIQAVMVMAVMVVMAMSNAMAGVHLKSIPYVGLAKADPGFNADMARAMAAVRASSNRDLPVRMAFNAIPVRNTYVLPGDVASPTTAPYGHVQWVIYVGWGDGGTMVSMANLSGMMGSSDSGNSLGKVFSLEGTTYSDLAIGYRSNQPDLKSGPASTPVEMFIVAVAFKSYAASEQEVKNFLYSMTNWHLTATATLQGVTDTLTLSRGIPWLMAQQAVNGVRVIAQNNGDPNSYELVGSSTLASNSWTPLGTTMRAGETNMLVGYTNGVPFQFVELRHLPVSANSMFTTQKVYVPAPPTMDHWV